MDKEVLNTIQVESDNISKTVLERLKASYHQDGYFLHKQSIGPDIIRELQQATEDIICNPNLPAIVYEKDKATIRGIHGCHLYNKQFQAICKNSTLSHIANLLLGEPCYLYPLKINIKAAHKGEKWPWHQDFIFWQKKDGMPHPKAVNIALFLDDVTQENGPLIVIKSSDLQGLQPHTIESGKRNDCFKENLKYTLADDYINSHFKNHQQKKIVGDKGTIAAFHPNIIHMSDVNLSTTDRRILILTFNATSNQPKKISKRNKYFVTPP